jgi:glyoxylase I family protein
LSIHRILAVLPVSDLGVAEAWYARLFDRPTDATPMANLREWHVGSAGLQVIEIPAPGGPAFVTLLANSIEDQRLALADRGLRLGASQPGDQGGNAQIVDPSGNTLTFAQRRAEPEAAPRANEDVVRA